LAFSRQFHGKPYDPGLFGGGQLLDFFNDGGRCHIKTIPNSGWYSNKNPLKPRRSFLIHIGRSEWRLP
jgi:hypothetical protein